MLTNFRDLGEQTLSKIAEMAIASQLQAEQVRVQVKSHPEKLARGIVDSLIIESQGLTTSNNQRLRHMNLVFHDISVNPLQALMGKIKLTQPSQGQAFFTLDQTDIEHWLNQVRPQEIQNINCAIDRDGKLALNLISHSEAEEIKINFRPQVCPIRNSVLLENSKNLANFREIWHQRILQDTEAFLNLQDFQLKGFSLKIHELITDQGRLTVRGTTKITEFPKTI